MKDFQWDDNDLEKLLGRCQNLKGDITAKAIMDGGRFSKSGRRITEALDVRYLMQIAVKKGKARVTKGFLVDESSYAIRLLPQEKPFSDELFELLSVFSMEGKIYEILPNKDLLKKRFPEIGDWSTTHDAVFKRELIYWRCMRDALFKCQFMGGNIENLPKCIDKKEFVLRLTWIICQYRALRICLKHIPLEDLTYRFDHVNGEIMAYQWDSIEVLFVNLLTTHASAIFAIDLTKKSSEKLAPSTRKKYLNEVRKDIKTGTEIYRKTPTSISYRRMLGDDLFDFKTESSKMYYFSSGTWFREKLKELGDLEADKALKEWAEAEDQCRIYQANK
jgi:hypothetical protein